MQNFDAQPLADFIAKYAKPYDPETDTYDRPPFTVDIKEGKNDPIYNAHSYHTKVPPRSIIPYILHYTEPGDVILDPFCGSGMTGVAALMCANPPADLLEQFPELKERTGARYTILNDLSPAACHIAYNYATPVDIEALRREFERIKAAVKNEFDWLYGTEHYEPAVGAYDPKHPEVAERLKNLPTDTHPSGHMFEGGAERTWELIDRAEVERCLGYPVAELPRGKGWGDLDLSKIDQWISIPATIQYTIWSDVYRCQGFVTKEEPTGKISTRGKNAGKPITHKSRVPRGCGKEIILWHTAVNHETGKVRETFNCPYCTASPWKKSQLPRTGCAPVITNILAQVIKHTKNGVESAHLRYDRRVTNNEFQKITKIGAKPAPYWIPETEMDTKGPQYRRSALNVRGIRKVVDFWTPRNCWAFASLWNQSKAINNLRLQSAIRFLLTSFVARVSRKAEYRERGGAGNTHNLTISSITREDNLLKSMKAKESDVLGYFTRMSSVVAKASTQVINESATSLSHIPSERVDYIFTDPPFGSNIYYSEPNLLWEAWLGRITDTTFEAVIHRKNDGGTKRLEDYSQLMQLSFAEMYRVLKPGRWATVEFNNSDPRVFEAIRQAIRCTGFEIVNMLLLDKKHKTFKQVKGAEGVEDVVDKDVLFNLHKPALTRPVHTTEDYDLEQQVVEAVREHLRTLPERIKAEPAKYNDDHRTTATINSILMNSLLPKGVNVERLKLPFIEQVCSRYFRKIGQRWYLRGEAVGNQQEPGGLLEKEVAIKDEVSAIEWIRQRLKAGPVLLGELRPFWMRATGLLPAEVSQTLVLEDLLLDNFWRDTDTNRWREPTDEERERMNDDRSLRVLHDAERFVAGTLSRKTTDAERCEWIDILFSACKALEDNEEVALPALRDFDPREGYRLISRLFQSVLREKVVPAAYARAEKQARVASQRLSKDLQEEAEKAEITRKKHEQPPLFNSKRSK